MAKEAQEFQKFLEKYGDPYVPPELVYVNGTPVIDYLVSLQAGLNFSDVSEYFQDLANRNASGVEKSGNLTTTKQTKHTVKRYLVAFLNASGVDTAELASADAAQKIMDTVKGNPQSVETAVTKLLSTVVPEVYLNKQWLDLYFTEGYRKKRGDPVEAGEKTLDDIYKDYSQYISGVVQKIRDYLSPNQEHARVTGLISLLLRAENFGVESVFTAQSSLFFSDVSGYFQDLKKRDASGFAKAGNAAKEYLEAFLEEPGTGTPVFDDEVTFKAQKIMDSVKESLVEVPEEEPVSKLLNDTITKLLTTVVPEMYTNKERLDLYFTKPRSDSGNVLYKNYTLYVSGVIQKIKDYLKGVFVTPSKSVAKFMVIKSQVEKIAASESTEDVARQAYSVLLERFEILTNVYTLVRKITSLESLLVLKSLLEQKALPRENKVRIQRLLDEKHRHRERMLSIGQEIYKFTKAHNLGRIVVTEIIASDVLEVEQHNELVDLTENFLHAKDSLEDTELQLKYFTSIQGFLDELTITQNQLFKERQRVDNIAQQQFTEYAYSLLRHNMKKHEIQPIWFVNPVGFGNNSILRENALEIAKNKVRRREIRAFVKANFPPETPRKVVKRAIQNDPEYKTLRQQSKVLQKEQVDRIAVQQRRGKEIIKMFRRLGKVKTIEKPEPAESDTIVSNLRYKRSTLEGQIKDLRSQEKILITEDAPVLLKIYQLRDTPDRTPAQDRELAKLRAQREAKKVKIRGINTKIAELEKQINATVREINDYYKRLGTTEEREFKKLPAEQQKLIREARKITAPKQELTIKTLEEAISSRPTDESFKTEYYKPTQRGTIFMFKDVLSLRYSDAPKIDYSSDERLPFGTLEQYKPVTPNVTPLTVLDTSVDEDLRLFVRRYLVDFFTAFFIPNDENKDQTQTSAAAAKIVPWQSVTPIEDSSSGKEMYVVRWKFNDHTFEEWFPHNEVGLRQAEAFGSKGYYNENFRQWTYAKIAKKIHNRAPIEQFHKNAVEEANKYIDTPEQLAEQLPKITRTVSGEDLDTLIRHSQSQSESAFVAKVSTYLQRLPTEDRLALKGESLVRKIKDLYEDYVSQFNPGIVYDLSMRRQHEVYMRYKFEQYTPTEADRLLFEKEYLEVLIKEYTKAINDAFGKPATTGTTATAPSATTTGAVQEKKDTTTDNIDRIFEIKSTIDDYETQCFNMVGGGSSGGATYLKKVLYPVIFLTPPLNRYTKFLQTKIFAAEVRDTATGEPVTLSKFLASLTVGSAFPEFATQSKRITEEKIKTQFLSSLSGSDVNPKLATRSKRIMEAKRYTKLKKTFDVEKADIQSWNTAVDTLDNLLKFTVLDVAYSFASSKNPSLRRRVFHLTDPVDIWGQVTRPLEKMCGKVKLANAVIVYNPDTDTFVCGDSYENACSLAGIPVTVSS